MRHALTLLGGATLGAGALYLLDQQQGTRRRAALMQERWPLPARVAAGMIGSALAWHGTSRTLIPGLPFTLIGIVLIGRALANGGLRAGRDVDRPPSVRGKTVKTTITINAPLDRVFEFWARYDETFPSSLPQVKQITTMGEGRARWVLDSPGTADIIWNTVLIRSDPNKELAWETEPGSAAQHTGRVRFLDSGRESTTLHLEMTYNALAEALARSMASAVGLTVERLFDEELHRIKAAVERERSRHLSSDRPAGSRESVG